MNYSKSPTRPWNNSRYRQLQERILPTRFRFVRILSYPRTCYRLTHRTFAHSYVYPCLVPWSQMEENSA